jgi:hypothetical protein
MFRMLLASVLYLALSAGANAQDMSELLTGEMRGLVVHDEPQPASDLPFLRVDGTEGSACRLRGPSRRPEFLGHVVRALPRGNAVAAEPSRHAGRR